MMVSQIDKANNQEKALDMHLMQLSLVDIATGKNSKFKVTEETVDQNATIQYILNSNVSFKLIFKTMKMTSINFLKPF